MYFQIETQLFTTIFTSSTLDVVQTTDSNDEYALNWQRLDRDTAYRLLTGQPDRLDTAHSLRIALGAEGGSTLSGCDDDAVFQQAARHLSNGWYCVINRVPSGGGWRGKDDQKIDYVTEAVEPEENPTGLPAKKEKDHWIIVELLGENGEPIPNELCRITLPDGEVIERETNSQGRVEEYMIIEGDCSIEFPELDRDAWEPWTGSAAT